MEKKSVNSKVEISNNHIIELKNVTKIFDGTTVIENMNLYIRKGEFVTLLGPSGCGKSTTLRMIAGFENPTSGDILLDGKDITILPPYKRPINTVFQHYALFPNLDVYENVAFGLRNKKIPVKKIDKDGNPILEIDNGQIKYLKTQIKRITKDKYLDENIKAQKLNQLRGELNEALISPKQAYRYTHLKEEEIDKKVLKALSIVNLDALEDRDIFTLSGGQQQRVAIARAIVCEPEILLLDEPLGALDLKMRKDMQIELKEMHKTLGITFIYVTHDQEEALTMSDTIVVMNNGVIEQIGTPEDIYNEPKNAYVADFIGSSNIYNGRMVGDKQVRFLDTAFKCVDDFPLHEKVDAVVRPEDIKLSESPKEGYIEGKIYSKVFKGMNYMYSIMIGHNEVIAQSIKNYDLNNPIYLTIEPDSIHLMKKEDETNKYDDSYIGKDHKLYIDDQPFDCDLSKLISGSTVSDDFIVHSQDNKSYDFSNADIIATVDPHDILISDDTSDCNIQGIVINSVYKGDHYNLLVKSEDDEDFLVVSEFTFNIEDVVGLKIPKDKIQMKLRGEIQDYEI